MRTSSIALLLAIGLGLISCTRSDKARRDEPAARQAGREAYRATQEIKRGAKQAGKELRKAGKELREGWNEEKRAEPPRRDK